MDIKWLQKQAGKGNSRAMCLLGNKYLDGDDVCPNIAEAIKWYQKAEDGGDPVGMAALGHVYLSDHSFEEAIKHFQKAAESKVTQMADAAYVAAVIDGAYHTGAMYYNGKGVKKDISLGKTFMKKAADAGDPIAKDFLELIDCAAESKDLL